MIKKFLKKTFKVLGILLLILAVVYVFGPSPATPQLDFELPQVPSELVALGNYVQTIESSDSIKPGNHARIVWADSVPSKTKYSVVYLHGFSASEKEGAPIHEAFAERYGCNLYLSRLAGHGLDNKYKMLNFTPESIVASAKEALAIGQQLGDSVILMTCSTGGTLGIFLAGGDYPIKALINFSPNIAMARWDSYLLNKPWGLQIGRTVIGGEEYCWSDDPETKKYWHTCYRIEALTQLQELLEATMYADNYAKVKAPFFMGYYFKNDSLQDPVVSVSAMQEMFDQLGTPDHLKRAVAFPEAGAHVICSPIKSNSVAEVQAETNRFAEEVLRMQPR